MCKAVTPSKECSLDTLELTVPLSDSKTTDSSSVLYTKRRRSKAITQSVNGKLLYLGSELHKDYQKAYYCNQYLHQNGNQVVAHYCRKRSCVVCSRIYAAKLMAGYVNPLMALNELHLVTLTAPNVKRDNLNAELDRFTAIWRLMYKSMKKKKVGLKGFKKIEITYSSKRDDFNPHFHVLVEGKTAAEQLRSEWLRRNPDASIRANHIAKVRDQGALIEVFKYVTKAVVKDTFDSRSLDAMYCAIHGKQVYSAFGIKKELEINNVEGYEKTMITHKEERIDVWKWCQDRKDWYSPTDEPFNDSKIDDEAAQLIETVDQSPNHVYQKEVNEYKRASISDIIKRSRDRDKILF